MKKKLGHKISSFLLIICLMMGCVIPVSAAAPKGTMALTADKTEVHPGDTFNVTLTGDAKYESIRLEINYDGNIVENTDVSTTAPGCLCNNQAAKSKIILTGSNAVETAASDGVLLKMTFKVKDNAYGKIDITPNVNYWKATNPEDPAKPLDIEFTMSNTVNVTSTKIPTDISALTAKITEAKGYSESAYTATSFAALKTAIADAEKITTENTKEEVQAQLDALQAAIDGLKKVVDKSALQTAVNAVPEDLSVYTPETAEAVQTALDEAQALLDNADLEDNAENQAAVKNAADQLNAAVDALQALPQKDVLAKKIADAEAKLNDGTSYMSADVAAVNTALDAAKAVNDNENATEAQVSEAIANLDKAVSALRVKADQAAYDAAVAQVKDSFAEENYTASSWKNFKTALDEAEALSAKMASEEVTQAEADAALEALQTTSKGLVPVATADEKAALEQAIADAEALKAENYTADSYTAVKSAIDAAKALDLKDSTSDEVTAATEALNNAVKGLVTTTADKDSGVVVEGLEAGTGITVADKTDDKDAVAAVEESVKAADVFAEAEKTEVLFVGDITPEVDPNGAVTVKIPVGDANYQTYYIGYKNADGEMVWTKAEVVDGMAMIQTDAFGEFSLVGVNFPEAQNPGTQTPGQNQGAGANQQGQNAAKGGNVSTGIYGESAGFAAAGILLLAAVGAVVYRRKYMR